MDTKMQKPTIATLSELKKSGYVSRGLKQELRENLIKSMQEGSPVFEGILGYEHSVVPEVQRAILAGHNINFLGLRGQAKTRIARQLVNLLDEWIPVIKGSEMNDDPLHPVSFAGRLMLEEMGDQTPVDWLHKSERYVEKLATPDVTVADLIGDVDPIKAASLKVGYNDERAIHFGLVPRSNRCIFVINELPDLQPRIQVALFNILQEGDIQIRGFKLRIPLDIQFVFTANPEDYTNRGSIITPLKDRIGSQILTHYPKDIGISMKITEQEAVVKAPAKSIHVPWFIREITEGIAFQARKSEFVDQKSGVSARLSISVYETVVAAAERRMLLNNEKHTTARVSDIFAAIPAINGKIEMVYEGEQEGPYNVAVSLIIQSIRSVFESHFPAEAKKRKGDKKPLDPYREIIRWFGSNALRLHADISDKEFKKQLSTVQGLEELTMKYANAAENELSSAMEWVLQGLAAMSKISMFELDQVREYSDLLNSMFTGNNTGQDDGGYYEE